MKVIDRSLVLADTDGAERRVLQLQASLAAAPGRVWAALVTADDLDQWLGKIDGELAAGGRFAIKDNASGRIHSCDPESLLDIDWNFGESQSRLRVELRPETSGTLITLRNSMPAVEDGYWNTYGPGAAGVGWEITLFGLEHYLDTGEALAEEPWVATEPAIALVRSSSEAWADLHRGIGAGGSTARQAAANTANFYLGLDGEPQHG